MDISITDRMATITAKNYYSDIANKEATYKEGLYGEIPDIHDDCYNPKHRCKDMMEWAYNNENQPVAEYFQNDGRKRPFLDASGANAMRNLGPLKNIWEKFVRETKYFCGEINTISLDINKVEADFWNYYIARYRTNFDKSVSILWRYVERRRTLMSESDKQTEKNFCSLFSDENNWKIGCRDYLKHLVFTSAKGYLMEILLFKILATASGGRIQESSIEDERNGIDGTLVLNKAQKYPVSLKPETWYNRKSVSPVYQDRLVVYKREGNDLAYTFKTGTDIFEILENKNFQIFVA